MRKDKPLSKPDKTTPVQDTLSRPGGYRMFTDGQLDEIHLASLEILRRTGVRLNEAESLALLQEASCIVTAATYRGCFA